MTDSKKPADAEASSDLPYLKERARFRSLLLTNPNYFGNIAKSPLKPVLKLQGDTTYEQIGCVGYEPQLSLLEAVVYIKQAIGYDGDICSHGSKEYVRFYLSFDNGATWQDQGEVSFTVYDIPAAARRSERLEYSCTLKVNPPHKLCKVRNIILARAILSWNTPNPPNSPNHPPVWGNVHNTFIQIPGFNIFKVKNIFELAELKIPDAVKELVDLEAEVKPLPPKQLTAFDLQTIYKDQKVEPHRFALKEAVAFLEEPSLTANVMTLDFKLPFTAINPADLFGPILAAQGDTRYEQLECIGFYPGDQEVLAGVIRVKLPSGYSGGPCTAGSFEYVTFWADLDNNGTFETCLGTTSVNVHDFNPIPDGGLEYAVYLPVNFDKYRVVCKEGPKAVRIRAILSWNVAPPCGNPNYPPVWGNRLETMILLRPGAPVTSLVPLLSRAGDVSYININAGGTSNGNTLETGMELHDSPFGGLINVAGKIPLAVPGMKYRIMRKGHFDPDTSYAPIVNEPQGIGLYISTWSMALGWTTTHVVKHALPPIAEGYYEYEDYSSVHFVEANLMGYWQTVPADDGGLFDLRIDVSTDGIPAHDLHSNVVTVLIDNVAPVALLDITIGGQCGDFKKGDDIAGTFTATDLHFSGFSFEIEPSGPPNFPSHGVLPVPPSGVSVLYGGAIGDPGVAGAGYVIHTGPMDACGYALILHVSDRTNVNNGFYHNTAQASVGFCLKKP